jgi:predicted dithiol-disulfide oxidoreductase (DUF899 family)
MENNKTGFPQIVSPDEWLKARKAFLKEEKAFTQKWDELNAKRRSLPMVKIEKDYRFDGAKGEVSLLDLFEGRQQLIVYHFMLDPDWDTGCPGCSFIADNIGHLSHLHARDTTLVMISRAPLQKIEKYRKRMGWNVPWYSSFSSAFNYDFHVTIDEDQGSDEYNYQKTKDLGTNWDGWKGEMPGISVFVRDGNQIFHTYSSYARGLQVLDGTLMYLDLTPLGRQDYWEKPEGRANSKAGAWWRRHDEYDIN